MPSFEKTTPFIEGEEKFFSKFFIPSKFLKEKRKMKEETKRETKMYVYIFEPYKIKNSIEENNYEGEQISIESN